MHKWALQHCLPERDNMQLILAGGGGGGGGHGHGSIVPAKGKLWAIPLPPEDYPQTEAVCLTGKTQLDHLRQLVTSRVNFALHIDGKHKLHHGKWILISIGCHDIAFDEHHKKIVHSYRPLVYMFSKQHETRENTRMLCDAVDYLARAHFGQGLNPGVVIMDHSDGFRRGVLDVWESVGAYLDIS
jgi:hypothetical protein